MANISCCKTNAVYLLPYQNIVFFYYLKRFVTQAIGYCDHQQDISWVIPIIMVNNIIFRKRILTEMRGDNNILLSIKTYPDSQRNALEEEELQFYKVQQYPIMNITDSFSMAESQAWVIFLLVLQDYLSSNQKDPKILTFTNNIRNLRVFILLNYSYKKKILFVIFQLGLILQNQTLYLKHDVNNQCTIIIF